MTDNVINIPIIGVGVIRKWEPTERFHFSFKTYEIFNCDDTTGSFQMATLNTAITTLEEAESILGLLTQQEDLKGQKLFIVEVSRKAIIGNFAASLIKRRQEES